jgi:hypothetical protein
MQERYEAAIKATFKYLDDYIADWENVTIGPYWAMIQAHMRLLGYEVICNAESDYADTVTVYPTQHNLPIHIWRRK